MVIRKIIVGVMGGGMASPSDYKIAYNLGGLIAKEGWVLLNGGRPTGIMDASAKGAKDKGGLTVGILPAYDSHQASCYIDIPIVTGMGDGRNYINVLSSDIVVALPGKAGTISEIALALKNRKKVILVNFDTGVLFEDYSKEGLLKDARDEDEVINIIKEEFVLKQ
ncbi:Rossmann fold nucleotide-binding protein [Desulfofarcimen acetoxidans DSM 771]|uniref:Rossmann fold nucleotide-binding protein n=1 Tax=Desulfofarcimen acetoxidans (strain ATCC 49208 / DSM 771 / KCTC 5769 / VKM B-1644 / 5575) TaxID=485916 RepID=C8VVL0_DESAS|nr:TIGR00725 family protein [Desulfofarcimen acetoxidans]ACV62325.1 Rossmann fold nucleotide-binding protein [Desulfofarcimen acetoxidans DSM 771]